MEKEEIRKLCVKWCGKEPLSIDALAGAGSPRRYYRVYVDDKTIVATCGDDMAENKAFVYQSQHFLDCGLPVPQVFAVNDDTTVYLQSDLGDTSLFDILSNSHEEAGQYVEASMRMLARFHYGGSRGLDFSRCFPVAEMDRRSVMWDLNYFKYSFLKPSGVPFSESALEDDFEKFADFLLDGMNECQTVMLRDFQSRNVMIVAGRHPYLIDYQGCRKGPACYDIVSFLWQAKARFTEGERSHNIDVYLDEAKRYGIDGARLRSQMPLFALFRSLQVLGAYGFRGLFEQKAHFLTSIPEAVDNLEKLLSSVPVSLSELRAVCERLCAVSSFRRQPAGRGLTVRVMSFSYKKGVPRDMSGNGGGFVFDCRAIHNPGRYEEYKQLTGMDKPVIDFLERNGEILTFLDNAYGLVDASVERYVKRGFSDLMICFGCTGGRHRSVYSAEAMARHIHEKYGVEVILCHREQSVNRKFSCK